MRRPAIEGHQVLSTLGVGATASVHLAIDLRPGPGAGQRVAVKVFRPDAASIALHERAVLAHLAAVEQVVDLRGWGEADGSQPYLSLAPATGGSLAARLAEQGPMRADEVARLAVGLLAAVASIHAAGVVHGDLKPANVLLGLDDRVVLGDFGTARWQDRPTSLQPVAGTVAHLAPEVLAGGPSSREADLFGVGSTLLTALAGREPPGAGGDHHAAQRRLDHGLPDPSTWGAPADLRHLVLRLTATDPAARAHGGRPWLGGRRASR